MEEIKTNFIKCLGKIDVQEGDIVVLKYNGRLSLDQRDTLKQQLEEVFSSVKGKYKILVLEAGQDITVMREKCKSTA